MKRVSFLVVASTLLVGCSASNSSHISVPSPASLISLAEMGRPIDDLLLPQSLVVKLAHKQGSLVTQCIHRRYPKVNYVVSKNVDKLASWSSIADKITSPLWGLYSPESMSTYGYHLPPSMIPSVSDEPSSPLPQALLDACENEAQKATPTGKYWMSYVGLGQLPEHGPAVEVDSKSVAAIISDWSACMGAYGYKYQSVIQPLKEYSSGTSTSPEELRTAQADLSCKASTQLISRLLIAQRPSDLAYVSKYRASVLVDRQALSDFVSS